MIRRQYMIHLSLLVVALIIVFYPYYKSKPTPQKVEASSVASLTFLALLDEGDYEQAWQGSSGYMKSEIPLATWLEQLQQVRSDLGVLQQRSQNDMKYTKDSIEGIPDGEYMSFFYSSGFSNRQQVRERVTLFLEGNNWKVAGYFVE